MGNIHESMNYASIYKNLIDAFSGHCMQFKHSNLETNDCQFLNWHICQNQTGQGGNLQCPH